MQLKNPRNYSKITFKLGKNIFILNYWYQVSGFSGDTKDSSRTVSAESILTTLTLRDVYTSY